jgi:hypothetical protein
MGRRLIYIKPQVAAYNPLTAAWIVATGETDPIILNALNTFEAGLIANNLIIKFNALYPFVGGTAVKHNLNFINTATYTLNRGATSWTDGPNGAFPSGTGYANTGLTPSTALSLNDSHLSVYTRTNSNVGTDIGVLVPGIGVSYISSRTGGNFIGNVNQGLNTLVATANSLGWYVASRTGATTIDGYKNGSSIIAGAQVTLGRPTLPIWLGARNNNGSPDSYAARELAFASIGSGLTSGEVSTLYTLIQAMQISLGRDV